MSEITIAISSMLGIVLGMLFLMVIDKVIK